MLIDYNSLLLALGISGLCLVLTLIGTWFTSKRDTFLLTWALGVLVLVSGVLTYDAYTRVPTVTRWTMTYVLLVFGLSMLSGAAYQFRTSKPPYRHTIIVSALPMALMVPILSFGVFRAGFVVMNFSAAILLLLSAYQYWRGRAEAPGPLISLAILYSITALSFLLCGIDLLPMANPYTMEAPASWIEDLNVVVCIAGMTGIGAMSLALNQWRLARRHERAAATDSMTGLLNRRALFERLGGELIDTTKAVILFDLDGFKTVNDRYGHAAGDAVICAFAKILSEHTRASDLAVRLGGEEFALVVERTSKEWPERIAETIRASFASREIPADGHTLFCTVSAGVAFGNTAGKSLDAILRSADQALYKAKRDGRNRVAVSRRLHAA